MLCSVFKESQKHKNEIIVSNNICCKITEFQTKTQKAADHNNTIERTTEAGAVFIAAQVQMLPVEITKYIERKVTTKYVASDLGPSYTGSNANAMK